MTPDTALTIIGMVVTVLASVGGAAWAISRASIQNAERMSKIEVKVDTVWDMIFKRAVVEAVQRGLGTVNSPFEINAEVKKLFESMSNELQRWHSRIGRYAVSDRELIMEVQRVFGEKIMKNVCIPYNLPPESAAVIAAAVAKGKDKIDIPSMSQEVPVVTTADSNIVLPTVNKVKSAHSN